MKLRKPTDLFSIIDIPILIINLGLIVYFVNDIIFGSFFLFLFILNTLRLYKRKKMISQTQYLEGDIDLIKESDQKSFKYNGRHYPDWITVSGIRYYYLGVAPYNDQGYCKKSDIDPLARHIYFEAQYGIKENGQSKKEEESKTG